MSNRFQVNKWLFCSKAEDIHPAKTQMRTKIHPASHGDDMRAYFYDDIYQRDRKSQMELIIYLEPTNLKYKQSYTRPRQVRTLDLDNKYKLTMPRQVHDSERDSDRDRDRDIGRDKPIEPGTRDRRAMRKARGSRI